MIMIIIIIYLEFLNKDFTMQYKTIGLILTSGFPRSP